MGNNSLTILLIESDQSAVLALREVLATVANMQFRLAHVEQASKALLWLEKAEFDAILLELSLDEGQGLELIGQLRTTAPHVPILVLTDRADEGLDILALQKGAQDYLLKADISGAELMHALRYAMARQPALSLAATPAESQVVSKPPSDTSSDLSSDTSSDLSPDTSSDLSSDTSSDLSSDTSSDLSSDTSSDLSPDTSSDLSSESLAAPLQAADPMSLDFQPVSFSSVLDKILEETTETSESMLAAEESSLGAEAQAPPQEGELAEKLPAADVVFPTDDPLAGQYEAPAAESEGTAISDGLTVTIKEDYQALVEAAERIFEAAEKGTEPDSASIIDAIWRALEQLRKSDELLEESIRQRRDYHSWSKRGANVAVLSIRLGIEIDCDERRCLALGLCGLMHDVGMLTIPQEVLDSPKFTAAQLQLLRQHPLESQKIIETFGDSFSWVGKIVAQAHERQDGSGYPRHLQGDQIHEVARILGLADTYEAMSHPRPDRKARATYNSLKEIVDQRNKQFDRRVIKALISIVSIFPLGSLVQLNNGEVGRVVKISRNFPTRPSLEIMLDPQGNPVNPPRFIDLENESLLSIVDPAIPEDILKG